MYYPYLRGKQYELIVVRENASLLAKHHFVPIIEPVRESFSGLQKALDAVCIEQGKIIIIVNPRYGDHQNDGERISQLLNNHYAKNNSIQAGILLNSELTVQDVVYYYENHEQLNPVLIHSGFTEPKSLALSFSEKMESLTNIFVEDQDRLLYRGHFNTSQQILINDGFQQRRNADYPEIEPFSDLHITYSARNMDGFGDFLIVGDNYSESGGPAYAVAIHLTFIDSDNDDAMYIYHFISDDKNTPTDPAGKFAQALDKLIQKFNSGHSKLYKTQAMLEFQTLHAKQHFPGLGYVKKLSMMHHIETLATFLSQ